VHMFNEILVAIDGSESSIYALEYAVKMATQNKAKLRILSVVEDLPTIYTAGAGTVVRDKLQESIKEKYQKLHQEQIERVKEDHPKMEIISDIREGKPSHQIKNASATSDLIVIGHRGQGAVLSWVLGSVAREVTEQCTVPVLIVKDLDHCNIN